MTLLKQCNTREERLNKWYSNGKRWLVQQKLARLEFSFHQLPYRTLHSQKRVKATNTAEFSAQCTRWQDEPFTITAPTPLDFMECKIGLTQHKTLSRKWKLSRLTFILVPVFSCIFRSFVAVTEEWHASPVCVNSSRQLSNWSTGKLNCEILIMKTVHWQKLSVWIRPADLHSRFVILWILNVSVYLSEVMGKRRDIFFQFKVAPRFSALVLICADSVPLAQTNVDFSCGAAKTERC